MNNILILFTSYLNYLVILSLANVSKAFNQALYNYICRNFKFSESCTYYKTKQLLVKSDTYIKGNHIRFIKITHYNDITLDTVNLKTLITSLGKVTSIPDALINLSVYTYIKIKIFPAQLKKLFINCNKDLSLPQSLRKLFIKDECLVNFLLLNLIKLIIVSLIDLINYLSVTLKIFQIYGNNFNLPIDNLSENLEILKIKSAKFNQPLDYLPVNLRKLVMLFSNSFNQALDNLLSNLSSLNITALSMNKNVLSLNWLSISLQKMDLVVHTNDYIDFSYLVNLEYVNFQFLDDPKNIEKSYLALSQVDSFTFQKINVTIITFAVNFNEPVENLPDSLLIINFAGYFNQLIDYLPEKFVKIYFKPICSFNQPIDYLLNSLKKLNLSLKFNQSIDNLPINLKTLSLNEGFKQPIDHLLENLKSLIITAPILAFLLN